MLDYSAPAVLALFHIGAGAVELASGLIFFIYAIGLVLGIRLSSDEAHESASLVDGLRDLMVPFIAGPLVLAAVLLYAIENPGWSWRTGVAGAYLAVLAIDLVCVLALAGVLRRTHRTVVDVAARLLGLLLAALSVEVLLDALADLRSPHQEPLRSATTRSRGVPAPNQRRRTLRPCTPHVRADTVQTGVFTRLRAIRQPTASTIAMTGIAASVQAPMLPPSRPMSRMTTTRNAMVATFTQGHP